MIILTKNGGPDTVSNIIPICQGCNRSMGAQNMDDFIKQYHPSNVSNFERICSKADKN